MSRGADMSEENIVIEQCHAPRDVLLPIACSLEGRVREARRPKRQPEAVDGRHGETTEICGWTARASEPQRLEGGREAYALWNELESKSDHPVHIASTVGGSGGRSRRKRGSAGRAMWGERKKEVCCCCVAHIKTNHIFALTCALGPRVR